MGKKKSGDAEEEADKVKSVFETLFGSVSDPNFSTSIFSDSNPFRRKRGDLPAQRFVSSGSKKNLAAEGIVNEGVVPLEHSDVAETWKRKRKLADGGNEFEFMPEVSETPPKNKKSEKFSEKRIRGKHHHDYKISRKPKELDTRDLNLDSREMNSVIYEEGDPLINNEEGRKVKRKREEIEKEYEKWHYESAGEVDKGMDLDGVKVAGNKRKTVDNAAETLVRNEGFDDEEKLLRTVFVGNLALKVKKKVLLKEFSQFGEIESVRIRSVPILDTKLPRKGAILRKKINNSADSVHAYVVFKTEQSAKASLAHNMSVISGNHIRVDRACPPRKISKGENSILYDIKRTLFVGNLPFDVKDEEVYILFSEVKNLENSIEAIRVVRDHQTNVGKGIAYVLFKTKDAADLAVKKRTLKLRDRELRLSRARAFSTPRKRKTTFSYRENGPDTPKKSKSRPHLSYQGLRGSKSKSTSKKPLHHKTSRPGSSQPAQHHRQVSQGRKHKRPAVAARKAAMRRDHSTTVAGKKRKAENWKPDRGHVTKKAKNSR